MLAIRRGIFLWYMKEAVCDKPCKPVVIYLSAPKAGWMARGLVCGLDQAPHHFAGIWLIAPPPLPMLPPRPYPHGLGSALQLVSYHLYPIQHADIACRATLSGSWGSAWVRKFGIESAVATSASPKPNFQTCGEHYRLDDMAPWAKFDPQARV